MVGEAYLSDEEVGLLMQEYRELRNRLRELSYSEVEGSEDFKRILRVQDRLIMFTVDVPSVRGLPETSGLVADVRELIRPHHTESKKYPFYSELAMRRDMTNSNHLYGRQK